MPARYKASRCGTTDWSCDARVLSWPGLLSQAEQRLIEHQPQGNVNPMIGVLFARKVAVAEAEEVVAKRNSHTVAKPKADLRADTKSHCGITAAEQHARREPNIPAAGQIVRHANG